MNIVDVEKFEEKLRLAMLASDVSVLDELISDSLVFTAPNGDVVNKQMDLECHKSGIQKLTELTFLERHIKIHNNFAIVAVKMKLSGTFNGGAISGIYSYTRIWSGLKDKLQVVGGHVSQI